MKAKTKEEEILRILGAPVVDLWKLREFALTEGGLVNGESSLYVGAGTHTCCTATTSCSVLPRSWAHNNMLLRLLLIHPILTHRCNTAESLVSPSW